MTRSEVIARKKKIRRRKQRAIQRMLCMAALMTAIVAALRAANSYLLRADSPVKPDHSRIQAAFLPVSECAFRSATICAV